MRIRITVLLILTALVTTACGDDDSGSLTAPTSPTTSGNTSGNPFGYGSFDGFSNQECLDIVLAWSQAASMGFAGGAGDLDAAGDALEGLAARVPPEVADDFAVYAQAVVAFGEAIADAGIDFSDPATLSSPEAQQVIAAAGEAFEGDAIVEAGENIGAFLEAQCAGG
jgi:hypothetical protein